MNDSTALTTDGKTGGEITDKLVTQLLGSTFSPALQIILNDGLYRRCMDVAVKMARAEGVTPKHLVSKPEACFAIVQMSIIWKLAPMMVAGATYQTPGGRIGYQGNLVHAILANSGRIKGAIKFEYFGEWEKVLGKFKIVQTDKGKYPAPTYTDKDEEGLGLVVSAQLVGEDEPRTFQMLLRQAFPRNSTLWATDPKTQLGYTAVRRFSSVATPELMMGVPFDAEDLDGGMVIEHDAAAAVQRPRRQTMREAAEQVKAQAAEVRDIARDAPAPAGEAPETVVEENDAEQHDEVPAEQDRPEEAPAPEETPPAEPEPPKAPVVEPKPVAAAKPAAAQPVAPAAPASAAPAPAAAPAAKPDVIAFTAQEGKNFASRFEKDIVKAASVLALDQVNQNSRDDLKRLKALSHEEYLRLLGMLTNKRTHLLNEGEE